MVRLFGGETGKGVWPGAGGKKPRVDLGFALLILKFEKNVGVFRRHNYFTNAESYGADEKASPTSVVTARELSHGQNHIFNSFAPANAA